MNNTEKQLLKRIEALEARGLSLNTECRMIDIEKELAHLSPETRVAFETDFEAVCKECGFAEKKTWKPGMR